jgi:hypothetical protein
MASKVESGQAEGERAPAAAPLLERESSRTTFL